MVEHLSCKTSISESQKEEYKKRLSEMRYSELLAEFFSYLDYKDESESGRELNPIFISCARVMLGIALEMVLDEMRKAAYD